MYTQFLSWDIQYCEITNSPKIGKCMQCDSSQNSNKVFAATDELILKFV